MMCAIMNKLRRISTAARHRPVFDLRIPALLYPGFLTPAEARREIGPCFFSSGLTQPLFTKLANLLQNKAHASEERSQCWYRQSWRGELRESAQIAPGLHPLQQAS